MKNTMKNTAAMFFVLIVVAMPHAAWSSPKNVVLFIGDGMGFEQVKAASFYAGEAEGSLCFESFPHQGEVTTQAADGSITDSAAAATAIATGHKVNNGVISVAIPGDASELQTLLEHYRDNGKSTGLVTTTYMSHATPAAFGAHTDSRGNTADIENDYFTQTRPNVLFGGGAHGVSAGAATAAGYTVVTNRSQMQALDTESVTYVSGQFGTDHLPYEYDYSTGADRGYDSLPHLSEMTETALAILDTDPDGFFLMVEGGRIDHAGHGNEIQQDVLETVEFARAVQKAVDWAGDRADTLIIVTADHETGGLKVIQNNGTGNFPTVSWSSGGHTGANVPVYAWGPNAESISGKMENTGFFSVATQVPETSPARH